jgi:hypothetical protein
MDKTSAIILFIAISIMVFYAALAVVLWAAQHFDTFYHAYVRQIRPEQYMQSVLLPLYGAVVGGLLSSGVAILVDPPPGKYINHELIASALFAAAVLVGVVAPLRTSVVYENRKKLLIGMRIDRLKSGDWTRDTRADVLKTIEEDRDLIIRNLKQGTGLFLVLLLLLVAADVNWLIFHRHIDGTTQSTETIAIAAIVIGIIAWRWTWPKTWQSALAELDSYRAEANKLSPPSPATATAIDYHHGRHDLWVAFGGLLVGAILAQVGSILRRSNLRD